MLEALSCLLQNEQGEVDKNWLICDKLAVKRRRQSKKSGSKAVGTMASHSYSRQGKTFDLETIARIQSIMLSVKSQSGRLLNPSGRQIGWRQRNSDVSLP